MKKLSLVVVFILLVSLTSCTTEHIHRFNNNECSCGLLNDTSSYYEMFEEINNKFNIIDTRPYDFETMCWHISNFSLEAYSLEIYNDSSYYLCGYGDVDVYHWIMQGSVDLKELEWFKYNINDNINTFANDNELMYVIYICDAKITKNFSTSEELDIEKTYYQVLDGGFISEYNKENKYVTLKKPNLKDKYIIFHLESSIINKKFIKNSSVDEFNFELVLNESNDYQVKFEGYCLNNEEYILNQKFATLINDYNEKITFVEELNDYNQKTSKYGYISLSDFLNIIKNQFIE